MRSFAVRAARSVTPDALARGGDAGALAALYDAHAPALYRVAYRITGSAVDAEDVVHDLFVGLPEALRRYEERGSLAAWLSRATVRLSLMRARSARRRHEAPLADADAAHSPWVADARAQHADVARAVAALPAGLRAVFVLKVVEGYAHDEIAALLGTTVGASRVRLARALDALRRALR